MKVSHRAWISPEGKVHNLPSMTTHAVWTCNQKNQKHMGGDKTTGELLRGGWIQKHSRYSYTAIQPGGVEAVRAHAKEHHPDELYSGVEVFHDIGYKRSSVIYHNSEDDEVTESSRTDEAIKAKASGGFNALLRGRLTAGWLSPEGELHPVKDLHAKWVRENAHKVPKELHKHFPTLEGGARDLNPYGTEENMLSAGWVKKTGAHVYEGLESAASMVHKHVREHHPEHKSVVLHLHNAPPGNNRMTIHHDGTTSGLATESVAKCTGCGKLVPGLHTGDEGVTCPQCFHGDGDPCMKCGTPTLGKAHGANAGVCPSCPEGGTRDQAKSWDDFMRDEGKLSERFGSSHRGWISPEGEYHRLNVAQYETHTTWMRSNRHKVQGNPIGTSGFGVTEHAMNRGWVRKVAENHYHVERAEHVPAAMAHAREHHPEVKNVHITCNFGKGFMAGVDEEDHHFTVPTSAQPPKTDAELMKHPLQGRMPNEVNPRLIDDHRVNYLISSVLSEGLFGGGKKSPSLRAWMSPDNEMHSLGAFGSHRKWIQQNQDKAGKHLAHHAPGVIDTEKTEKNLVNAGWVQYQLGLVKAHSGHMDRAMDQYKKNWPKHSEVQVSRTDRDYGERVAEYKKDENGNWVPKSHINLTTEESEVPSRAWISPAGKVHNLGGPFSSHTSWVEENQDKVPWQGSHFKTEDQMMKDGWVRKHDANDYEVGTDTAHAAAKAHLAKHYPQFLPKFHNIRQSRYG